MKRGLRLREGRAKVRDRLKCCWCWGTMPFVAQLTRSLSVHADYRCQHAGACCTAGWPIPIEEPLRGPIARGQADGRLPQTIPVTDATFFVPHQRDVCIFFDEPGSRLCAIQGALGAGAMPASCRHFPRVALLDPRGVSITLSHFCPTAARMLFRDDVPLAIVENPPAFPPEGEYEGLDAREVLPPLLRPGLLWDFEGYSAWERGAVALLASDAITPAAALRSLGTAAGRIEGWRPARAPLAAYVERVFGDLPIETRPPASDTFSKPLNRYLAARLFASWVPYQATHLTALVADLEMAYAMVLRELAGRVQPPHPPTEADLREAIRRADLALVHGR